MTVAVFVEELRRYVGKEREGRAEEKAIKTSLRSKYFVVWCKERKTAIQKTWRYGGDLE